jgi:hypothetical protein
VAKQASIEYGRLHPRSEEKYVGVVISFQPDEDSPVLDMPWFVTFHPSDDDDEWDSVAYGPYRREHAEALAAAVITQVGGVVAVVEPLCPALDAETVVDAIQQRRDEAAAEGDADDDLEDFEDEEVEEIDVEETTLPEPAEIRDGMDAVVRQVLTNFDAEAERRRH